MAVSRLWSTPRNSEMGRAVIDRARYEIRVNGTLDRRWWGWFEDYTITTEPSGDTRLSGQISDQRLLIGTLVTLHEFGHPLVSVVLVPQAQEDRGERFSAQSHHVEHGHA